jgi:hypothetical protein
MWVLFSLLALSSGIWTQRCGDSAHSCVVRVERLPSTSISASWATTTETAVINVEVQTALDTKGNVVLLASTEYHGQKDVIVKFAPDGTRMFVTATAASTGTLLLNDDAVFVAFTLFGYGQIALNASTGSALKFDDERFFKTASWGSAVVLPLDSHEIMVLGYQNSAVWNIAKSTIYNGPLNFNETYLVPEAVVDGLTQQLSQWVHIGDIFSESFRRLMVWNVKSSAPVPSLPVAWSFDWPTADFYAFVSSPAYDQLSRMFVCLGDPNARDSRSSKNHTLVTFDARSGKVLANVTVPYAYEFLQVSPDGRFVVGYALSSSGWLNVIDLQHSATVVLSLPNIKTVGAFDGASSRLFVPMNCTVVAFSLSSTFKQVWKSPTLCSVANSSLISSVTLAMDAAHRSVLVVGTAAYGDNATAVVIPVPL